MWLFSYLKNNFYQAEKDYIESPCYFKTLSSQDPAITSILYNSPVSYLFIYLINIGNVYFFKIQTRDICHAFYLTRINAY